MAGNKFDWGDRKSFQDRKQAPRVSDIVEMLDLSDGEWHPARLIGEPVVHMMHWLPIKTKTGKKTRIPKPCLNYPDGKGKLHECPYCKEVGAASTHAYTNVIDRELQENMPRKLAKPSKKESEFVEWNGGEWRLKEGKTGGGWTPVRVIMASTSLGSKISDITSLNKRTLKNGSKKIFPPQHPTKGFDLLLKYDDNASQASNKYSVNKGENTVLQEDELDYLLWAIPPHWHETPEEAESEIKKIRAMLCDKDGNLVYGKPRRGDDEETPRRKKRNEYADEFDDDDDLEDDEDEAPSRSKKSAKSKKSRWVDEEDDIDVEDDEEEYKPRRKVSASSRKSSSNPSRKKVKPKDDEYDDDEIVYDDDIPF